MGETFDRRWEMQSQMNKPGREGEITMIHPRQGMILQRNDF